MLGTTAQSILALDALNGDLTDAMLPEPELNPID
jgi:hypothetical protein